MSSLNRNCHHRFRATDFGVKWIECVICKGHRLRNLADEKMLRENRRTWELELARRRRVERMSFSQVIAEERLKIDAQRQSLQT